MPDYMRNSSRRAFLRASGAALLAGNAAFSDQQGSPLRIGYVDDAAARRHLNASRQNYWDAYIPEILDELGLHAEPITPESLSDAGRLREYSTILLGALDAGGAAPATLRRWTESGGTLIAFAARGLDELCGNRTAGSIAEQDEFAVTATFALRDIDVASQIHSVLQPAQRLLALSSVEKVQSVKSTELARLFNGEGGDTGCAAITKRRVGGGAVFYFAFSVPKTIWVLHQGRPVLRDLDGDGLLRRSDAIVIRPHSIEVGYADELLFLLQNMIGRKPHAFVHPLPPMRAAAATDARPGSRIPDALFHWGGDDEGSSNIQLTSSNWMKEHGLPYHVNALPRRNGTFGLSLEDARKIEANGHEISLHFNFIDTFAPGAGFSESDVKTQAQAFRKYFGRELTCTVNHVSRWFGWAEPALWMRDAGIKADNTFVHAGSPPHNPVNLLGFSFGTAFPFWFYDDWSGSNQRIDFLEQPISAYECGYTGTEQTDFPTVRKAIDTAVRYHLTMNMFYHPIYIATYPACRRAIQEVLRYIGERRIVALHMGSDAFYRWWEARSQARISVASSSRGHMRMNVSTRNADGIVAKVPLNNKTLAAVSVNGAAAPAADWKTERRFGQNWGLIAVPDGASEAALTFR